MSLDLASNPELVRLTRRAVLRASFALAAKTIDFSPIVPTTHLWPALPDWALATAKSFAWLSNRRQQLVQPSAQLISPEAMTNYPTYQQRRYGDNGVLLFTYQENRGESGFVFPGANTSEGMHLIVLLPGILAQDLHKYENVSSYISLLVPYLEATLVVDVTTKPITFINSLVAKVGEQYRHHQAIVQFEQFDPNAQFHYGAFWHNFRFVAFFLNGDTKLHGSQQPNIIPPNLPNHFG